MSTQSASLMASARLLFVLLDVFSKCFPRASHPIEGIFLAAGYSLACQAARFRIIGGIPLN